MADSDWKYVQRNKVTGQYKTTSGGGGGGGASALSDLDDVNISSASDGQVLKYDNATGKWVNANESGGGGTVTDVQVDGTSVVDQGVAEIPAIPEDFSDLSDVQFNNLSDHQPLRYNATSQKWVNGADSYPPLIYSDVEREVGVWDDGKPLYEKCINITSLPSVAGDTSYPTNISNVDKMWIVGGYCIYDNGAQMLPLNVLRVPDNDRLNGIGCRILNKNNICFSVGYDRSNFSAIVIINYTKTTDTAGSGTWTTEGTPTHHYSTTEQVIGTWIDGKTLYEKTYEFSTPVQVRANQFNTLISSSGLNIETLVNGFSKPDDGSTFAPISLNVTANGDIEGYYPTAWSIKYLCLQYTKTSS